MKPQDLAIEYGLPILHPAVVQIIALERRVAELEKQLGRPYVIENGPWTASDDGHYVESDDFTHDVCLRISGDFSTLEERKIYAKEISRRLNNTHESNL